MIAPEKAFDRIREVIDDLEEHLTIISENAALAAVTDLKRLTKEYDRGRQDERILVCEILRKNTKKEVLEWLEKADLSKFESD